MKNEVINIVRIPVNATIDDETVIFPLIAEK